MVDTQERLRKAVHAVGGIPTVTAAVEPDGDKPAYNQLARDLAGRDAVT
jgi:hypothetical protein